MIHQFDNSSLEYDPETGIFHWVICWRKPWLNGEVIGNIGAGGYLYVKADGKNHSLSRLAWSLYNNRPVPKDLVIDHINRNNKDNRAVNLRAVTQEENLHNSQRPVGQSGIRGVRVYNRPSGNGNLWRVTVDGTIKYYETLEEATAACPHDTAGYATLVEKWLGGEEL